VGGTYGREVEELPHTGVIRGENVLILHLKKKGRVQRVAWKRQGPLPEKFPKKQ